MQTVSGIEYPEMSDDFHLAWLNQVVKFLEEVQQLSPKEGEKDKNWETLFIVIGSTVKNTFTLDSWEPPPYNSNPFELLGDACFIMAYAPTYAEGHQKPNDARSILKKNLLVEIWAVLYQELVEVLPELELLYLKHEGTKHATLVRMAKIEEGKEFTFYHQFWHAIAFLLKTKINAGSNLNQRWEKTRWTRYWNTMHMLKKIFRPSDTASGPIVDMYTDIKNFGKAGLVQKLKELKFDWDKVPPDSAKRKRPGSSEQHANERDTDSERDRDPDAQGDNAFDVGAPPDLSTKSILCGYYEWPDDCLDSDCESDYDSDSE